MRQFMQSFMHIMVTLQLFYDLKHFKKAEYKSRYNRIVAAEPICRILKSDAPSITEIVWSL